MIRKLQVTIMLLIIPLGGLYIYAQRNNIPLREIIFPGTPVLHIGDIPLRIEIAQTPSERKQGLSGRDDLGDSDGLLFVFDEPDYHGIWMKDMKFSIDVIWISEDLEVIGVTRRLTPESYPRVFEPPSPAKYAVETETRFSDTFGIKAGDIVRLPSKYFK